MLKAHHIRTTVATLLEFELLKSKCHGFCTLPKVRKMRGFCSSFKNHGERQTFEERRHAQYKDVPTRHVGRSARRFPETGCMLEHHMMIIRVAKKMLVDRCSTSYDPTSLFRGRRGKIARRIGTKPSALHSTSSCLKEVSQISFFDAVNFELWRKSPRISGFWSCELPFLDKVSQRFDSLWTCQLPLFTS